MSDSSIIFVELMRREREKIEKKLFRPPGDCMNTNKEENKRLREKLREKLREERANDDNNTTDKGSD